MAPLREIYIFKSTYVKIINKQRVVISYIGVILVYLFRTPVMFYKKIHQKIII